MLPLPLTPGLIPTTLDPENDPGIPSSGRWTTSSSEAGPSGWELWQRETVTMWAVGVLFKGGSVWWSSGYLNTTWKNNWKKKKKSFSQSCIITLATADKGYDNIYNQAMEFHNLTIPELIILIFLSGLEQHCAEQSSRVPNCSSLWVSQLLFSLKENIN